MCWGGGDGDGGAGIGVYTEEDVPYNEPPDPPSINTADYSLPEDPPSAPPGWQETYGYTKDTGGLPGHAGFAPESFGEFVGDIGAGIASGRTSIGISPGSVGSAIVGGLLGMPTFGLGALGLGVAGKFADKITGARDIININVKGDVGGVLGSKLGSGGTLGGQ